MVYYKMVIKWKSIPFGKTLSDGSDRKEGNAVEREYADGGRDRTRGKLLLLVLIVLGECACTVQGAGITPGVLLFASAAAGSAALLADRIPLPLALLCLLPAIPFAYASNGSCVSALRLFAVLLLIPAAYLPLTGKGDLRKAAAVSAFPVTLAVLGILAALMLRTGNGIGPEAAKTVLARPLDAVREAILSVKTTHDGREYALFDTGETEYYVDALLCVLPGLIGNAALVLSWLTAVLARVLSLVFGFGREEAEERYAARASAVSGLFYLIPLLLILFPLPAVPFYVCANLMLLFLPGALLECFAALRFLWKEEAYRLGALVLTVLLILLIPKHLFPDILLSGALGGLSAIVTSVLGRVRNRRT